MVQPWGLKGTILFLVLYLVIDSKDYIKGTQTPKTLKWESQNYQVTSPTTWGIHEFFVDFDSKSLKSNIATFENNIPTTYQAPKFELFDLSIRSARKMSCQFESQKFSCVSNLQIENVAPF